jgi:predicted 3-demethylubiquinone-9 3-methyltransferase (glyoxalase superfamily)
MQKITPFLWFDNNAEEAVNFYLSVFRESKITAVSRYPEGAPGPAGQVMTMSFNLRGQEFMALNGGPVFKFNESISFFVRCKTQGEVDMFWEKLSEGGQKGQCGWLKDKYGISWQIVPDVLGKLIGDMDPIKAEKVTKAMLQMTKLDIEGLRRAYKS